MYRRVCEFGLINSNKTILISLIRSNLVNQRNLKRSTWRKFCTKVNDYFTRNNLTYYSAYIIVKSTLIYKRYKYHHQASKHEKVIFPHDYDRPHKGKLIKKMLKSFACEKLPTTAVLPSRRCFGRRIHLMKSKIASVLGFPQKTSVPFMKIFTSCLRSGPE